MDQIITLTTEYRTASKDEAVKSFSFRPARQHEIAGPYEDYTYPNTFHYVPSLQYLCLRALFAYPDQLEHFHDRQVMRKIPTDSLSFDLLKAICPSHGHKDELDWSTVDPRLWATICQIFEPSSILEWPTTYRLPLSDQHMKLLQQIPSTPNFSLVTVLELPACKDLTDETIFSLKHLHSLVALDASETSLSSQGVWHLCRLPQWSVDDPLRMQGPWGLTMLRLRSCVAIDDNVYQSLERLPLLSAVDLSNTQCRSDKFPAGFQLGGPKQLFYPTRICDSLSFLKSQHYGLFSSSSMYTLHIDQLTHPPRVVPLAKLSADNNFGEGKKSFVSEANEHSQAGLDYHEQDDASRRARAPIHEKLRAIRARKIMQRELDEAVEEVFDTDEQVFRLKQFYGSGDGNNKPVMSRGPRHYNADNIRIQSIDPRVILTLYRDPPGWRTLRTCTPPTSAPPSKRLADTTAKLDRKSSLTQSRVQALQHSMSQVRSRVEEKKSLSSEQAKPISSTSKNPFRSSSTSSKKASHHLKPITALKVPELSESQLASVAKPTNKKPRTEAAPKKQSNASSTPTGGSSKFNWQKWAK